MNLFDNYKEQFSRLMPKINENIKKHRMGDIVISVYGEDNKKVKATVALKQISHDFSFGCNGLLLGQSGELNSTYEQKFLKLFNLVTTTLCWSITETKEGVFRFADTPENEMFRRPPVERVISFAKKNGLRLKGQPLLADSWYPKWASHDKDEARREYNAYFKQIAERYGDDFYLIDVINEAYLCKQRTPDFPLYDEKLSYIKTSLCDADRYFCKGVRLERNEYSSVNEGECGKRYFDEIKGLIDEKVRLDSVGFQFHFFTGDQGLEHLRGERLSLERIYENYMRFCRLNIPMYISEVTVPSKFEGISLEEGRALQALVVESLYKLWFSVPNMNGIIYWNFMDGKAWQNEGDCLGCLLAEDGGEKPSYKVLDRLINDEWRTNETLICDGNTTTRGFFGNYEATITAEGKTKTVKFSHSKNNITELKFNI